MASLIAENATVKGACLSLKLKRKWVPVEGVEKTVD